MTHYLITGLLLISVPSMLTPAVALRADAGNECPAYVTLDHGEWSWDCLDDCTGACFGYETVDHNGTYGYACGCTTELDADCCHIVYLPNAPRKASHNGHCGGLCDPGTICWTPSFTNSQGVTVYVSACI